MTRAIFINTIKEELISECKGTGLFPSLMIAQACLESRNGASLLSVKYHNYFGMKPNSNWHGPIVEMNTKEYIKNRLVTDKQPFRVYTDIKSCFADHIKLFQTVKVYTVAGVFKCITAEEQANALHKAGYATDPAYTKKLIDIINENNLKQYDQK